MQAVAVSAPRPDHFRSTALASRTSLLASACTSKAAVGDNCDTVAADLDAVLSTLNLTDVSLVRFSMGAGEVARYIGKYGTRRVRKAVLNGAWTRQGYTSGKLEQFDAPAGTVA